MQDKDRNKTETECGGIDIVVPVYRVEKYLQRCVDSILHQSYRNFRLILVDDGSDDGSPAMCDAYAVENKEIHVIHKKNGGLSDARNAGIEWALAESENAWITFIDSDDCVHPQFLEYLYKAVSENHVDISRCELKPFTDERELDNACQEYDVSVMNGADAYVIEGSSSNVCAQGKLYRKEMFEDIRYPVGKLHEDLFTTYKLVLKCDKAAVLKNGLYMYFINEEGITHSKWKPKRLDELEAFDQQLEYFKGNKKTYVLLLKKYLHAIGGQYNQLEKIRDEMPDYSKYNALLKNKMRSVIRNNLKYHTEVFPSCRWCYGIAFPNIMKVYWKLQSVLGKK